MKECSIEKCENISAKRGWCWSHYNRWRRYGDPFAGSTFQGTPHQFFLEQILRDDEPHDDCFIWIFGKTGSDYGSIVINGVPTRVHRLACRLVNGPPADESFDAAHGPCHDRRCFRPKHLSWKTTKENLADRWRDGTHPGGEDHPMAKLTANQVNEIRDLYARGGETYEKLGTQFGVNKTTIGAIIRGNSWASVSAV